MPATRACSQAVDSAVGQADAMADPVPPEGVLTGGWEQDALVERDGTLYRKAGPQIPAVLGLLQHLEAEGFRGSPRVVGTGFEDEGHETVTFIEGFVQHRGPWSASAFVALGHLVRELHELTRPIASRPAPWRPTFVRGVAQRPTPRRRCGRPPRAR